MAAGEGLYAMKRGPAKQDDCSLLPTQPMPTARWSVHALLWVDKSPRAWNEPLALLANMGCVASVNVACAEDIDRAAIRVTHPKIKFLKATDPVAASREMVRDERDLFLFVAAPVRPSPDALDLAGQWMSDDPRIGTISFLSNAGGYISFPHRNTGTPFGVDEHDEVSLTALLRSRRGPYPGPAPLPVAEGAMVLVNRSILEVCDGLDDAGTGNLSYALAELSLRGARRGFNSFLDPFTFVSVPFDSVEPFQSVLADPSYRAFLQARHKHFPAVHDTERDRGNSILAQTLDSARANATGLRVLIDGSALGPKEMGTQMLIVNLSKALADRKEIQFVAVAVPDPRNIPAYARELVTMRKIRLVTVGELDFPDAPYVDIIHRPFQPSSPIPWDRWRQLAKRSIITVQDLIAYRNAAYFSDWGGWNQYRENFGRQVSQCDAVISISRDVVNSIKEERMPIEDERIFVVENGADARSKDEPTRVPDAILDRGWASCTYLFVLGATYAHKNRDLALRVWAQLRARGHKHKLVLVGASVPYGSTRTEEILLSTPELLKDILNLPEVSSDERNWLLANAGLAVYLTSAEGFGQVPFEAARMGVPTLHVSFGPLRELIDDASLPSSYEIGSLVSRAEALISDVDASAAAVKAALKSIDRLTWAETARKSVEAYFDVLANPARAHRI